MKTTLTKTNTNVTKPKTTLTTLLAATIILAAFASGCGEITTTSVHSADASGCTSSGSNGTARAPLVAVLAQPGGGVYPEARATVETILAGATAMHAHVIVGEIGETANPRNLAVNTTLTAEGPNELLRGQSLDCKTAAIKHAYNEIARRPEPPHPTVLAALRQVHEDIEALPAAPVSVVVIGSMLTGIHAIESGLTSLNGAARVINGLAASGLIFPCKHWRVYAVVRASGGEEQQARLQQFWSTYFEHCGGALVAWDTALPTFPVANAALQSPDYALLPIQVHASPAGESVTLRSDYLFELNSAGLLPAAGHALDGLLPSLRRAVGAVNVTGYTDSTGTAQINAALSLQRAQTVAAWITARLGSLPVTVHGLGEHDPVADNQTARGRAENRRVTLTINYKR